MMATMKTECPHCHTIFAVTQEQLNLADGMVRCGVCQETFSALVQEDLFNQSQPDDDLNDTPDKYDGNRDDIAEDFVLRADDSSDASPQATVDDNATFDADYDDELQAGSDTDSLFDTADEQQRVIPDEFRYSEDRRQSFFGNFLWGLGSLALTATLLLQFAWFDRHNLVRQDWMQTPLSALCSKMDCSELGLRDPLKIEMTSRNVYTHPTVDDALMIALTIVNQAGYAQDYPDIRIDFSDVAGNVVASRQLSPDAYLAIDHADHRQLQPNAPVSFSIEVQDPGKKALTYEFDFL